MVDKEICFRSALDLAKDIREKKLSPVEIVENSLRRIEEVNPQLNGFCFVYAEEAIDKARNAERDVQLTIELQMEQALLTVESPINTGKIWWARLDLNQRPLPCEGSALFTNSPKTR